MYQLRPITLNPWSSLVLHPRCYFFGTTGCTLAKENTLQGISHRIQGVWMQVAAAALFVLWQIQYPDALKTMSLDLKNIRLMASYLSKTELKFDLVSPVRPKP